MALSISYNKHIVDELQRSGYKPRPWRHGALGTRVYERDGHAVVIVQTIEIPPPHIQPVTESSDRYFERLRDALASLGNKYKVSDLFLPGGGMLPLPGWFSEWCMQKGIRVHIVDADNCSLPDLSTG